MQESSMSGFDRSLIERYDVRGPRYTSYPTANHFHEGAHQGAFAQAVELAVSRLDPASPVSVYVHVPFCSTICYYCACNKINTANKKHADAYIDRLVREFAMVAERASGKLRVDQVHFGGGTPTFLSDDQFARVFSELGRWFDLSDDEARDFSVEIDPRGLDPDRVRVLGTLGFNRMSIGIQDFDPAVQKAVNRVQSVAETEAIVQAARTHGFTSINFDLIYGLPKQTLEGFTRTLDEVVRLGPDRLSIYSYAHLPELFKTQKQIDVRDLLAPECKLDLLERAVAHLTQHGYTHIGMDHFARSGDGLVKALEAGTVHRSFQGFTTHSDCALLGFGVSSISTIDGLYTQNFKTLEEYYTAVDEDRLPTSRGYQSSPRDRMVNAIMQSLMCCFELDVAVFGRRFGEEFRRLLGSRAKELAALEADGLIEMANERIAVTRKGRYLIRNICMTFDEYLGQGTATFSKAI
jgi:oxygen-independent coproporphyrinogen-3 oxidase